MIIVIFYFCTVLLRWSCILTDRPVGPGGPCGPCGPTGPWYQTRKKQNCQTETASRSVAKSHVAVGPIPSNCLVCNPGCVYLCVCIFSTSSPFGPDCPWFPGSPRSPFSPMSPGGPIRPIRPPWPCRDDTDELRVKIKPRSEWMFMYVCIHARTLSPFLPWSPFSPGSPGGPWED